MVPYLLSALLALAIPATAFPAAALQQLDMIARVVSPEDVAILRRAEIATRRRQLGFDPSKQYISTTGINRFIPPNFSAGDQRGPCPGLNALANHGYLPRNGVAGMNDIIDATGSVYGMAVDLSTFLSVFGTAFDGSPVSASPGYSIGGVPPSGLGQNILGGVGLLGTPQGLTGSHNKYESDASTTRGDLYVFKNNYMTQPPFFKSFYESLIEGVGRQEQYTGWAEHHIGRFTDSVNTNPYFFFAPFAGVLVTPAGWSFPAQMMSNHSAEFPDGSLTGDILKSFFSITGTSDNFKYTEGYESIPDNWYRRPLSDFTIPGFLLDVLEHGVKYPRLLSVGGNTGKVNTFTGVDIGNLTGGVYNFATLTQGNNLICFVLAIIQASAPDILGSMFSDPKKAGQPLVDQLQQQIVRYGCPQIAKFDEGLYDQYPGYNATLGAV